MDPAGVPTVLPHVRVGPLGAVSAPSTDAARIGCLIIEAGGNAFDAAVAMAFASHISNTPAIGIGGDLVAMTRADRGSPTEALVACGPAPADASVDAFRQAGHDDVPRRGIRAAAVPGFLDGVLALASRGRLPLASVLEPVISFARRGAMVSRRYSIHSWLGSKAFGDDVDLAHHHHVAGGEPPIGSVRTMPDLAAWLEVLAVDAPGARQRMADEIVDSSDRRGGFFSAADFERSTAEWCEPLTVQVGDLLVATSPAPTQGRILEQVLRLGAEVGLGSHDVIDDRHLLVEVTRAMFAEVDRRGLGDGHDLVLTEAEHSSLAATMGPDAVADRSFGAWPSGTASLTAVDADGGAVSLIGSLSWGFGCGVGVIGGDVLLSSRLARSTVLDDASPFAVRGGVRPLNTIHCWMAEGRGEVVAGGTYGGADQVPFNAQVLTDVGVRGWSWSKAIGAARIRVMPGPDRAADEIRSVIETDRAASELIEELRARGHLVEPRRDVGGCFRLCIDAGSHVGALGDGRAEGDALAC